MLVLTAVALCTAGWWLEKSDAPNLDVRLSAPSLIYFAGTDHLGRDVFSRVLRATAEATTLVLPAWAIATAIGLIVGVSAAVLANRPIGRIFDWAIKVTYATPFLLVLVGLGAVLGRGTGVIFGVIVLWAWAPPARMARAVARDALHALYTRASFAMGFSFGKVIRHVLIPVCAKPVVTASATIIAELLALDMALALFGFGPSPPHPTLGIILSDGLRFFGNAPWITLTPVIVVLAICLCVRSVIHGEYLRQENRVGAK